MNGPRFVEIDVFLQPALLFLTFSSVMGTDNASRPSLGGYPPLQAHFVPTIGHTRAQTIAVGLVAVQADMISAGSDDTYRGGWYRRWAKTLQAHKCSGDNNNLRKRRLGIWASIGQEASGDHQCERPSGFLLVVRTILRGERWLCDRITEVGEIDVDNTGNGRSE